MTDIATTSDRKLEDGGEAPPVTAVPVTSVPVTSVPDSTESQVLITEQQVLFSTAAAVPLPPAKTRRWTEAVRAVAASVRAAFATSGDLVTAKDLESKDARPKRRHYPPRNDYPRGRPDGAGDVPALKRCRATI